MSTRMRCLFILMKMIWAVMISQKYWQGLTETLLLEQAGVMQKIRERETDGSGFADIDALDWKAI